MSATMKGKSAKENKVLVNKTEDLDTRYMQLHC